MPPARRVPRDRREQADRIIGGILLAIALSAVSVLLLLTLFIFREGLPIFSKVGVMNFLLGLKWAPGKNAFGILPMIAGSVWVTGGALVLGVPLGLASALFLSEIAPLRLSRIMKPAIELLAAIPSVVYGFIGLVVLVPLIRSVLGGPGFSVLASSVVLAIMVLPTIISISYDALKAVPVSFREGSLALGASRWQTMIMVLVPGARSGIVAGIILGMGRAVGETMAVIMVAGNATTVPRTPLDPVRTLTSNIALEMGYASGDHRTALFATGVVLFAIIMMLNTLATSVTRSRVRAAFPKPHREAPGTAAQGKSAGAGVVDLGGGPLTHANMPGGPAGSVGPSSGGALGERPSGEPSGGVAGAGARGGARGTSSQETGAALGKEVAGVDERTKE